MRYHTRASLAKSRGALPLANALLADRYELRTQEQKWHSERGMNQLGFTRERKVTYTLNHIIATDLAKRALRVEPPPSAVG
jgi:hypothetical protein